MTGAIAATVFKARQISVDRIVAIKVLRATWAHDADHVERFCRESLIAAQLLHPNIVATIDAGVADDRPYLVMEYVPGFRRSTSSSRKPRDLRRK